MAYGPGFYIPPPGYQASAIGAVHDKRTGAGQGDTRGSVMAKVPTGGQDATSAGSTSRGGTAGMTAPNGTSVLSQTGSNREYCHRQSRYSSRRGVAGRRSHIPGGVLIMWATFAVLLAIAQAVMLDRYEHRYSPICEAISYASLFLELYGAFVAVVGILCATSHWVSPVADTTTSPTSSPPSTKSGITSSVLKCLPSLCGLAVCLGGAMQTTALVVYAIQSTEPAVKYSMIATLLIALVSTFLFILFSLDSNGLLCSSDQHHRHKNNSRSQPTIPTLPISERDPGSHLSTTSSQSGKYIPDYGLDSDSDSDDFYNPGAKHARADWTDKLLDGLIRSPLLDMPPRR